MGKAGVGECTGSLTVYHVPKKGPKTLDSLKELKLSPGDFKRLRQLRRRECYRYINSGQCCWKLFARPNFRGNVQDIQLGARERANFTPSSVMRVPCESINGLRTVFVTATAKDENSVTF